MTDKTPQQLAAELEARKLADRKLEVSKLADRQLAERKLADKRQADAQLEVRKLADKKQADEKRAAQDAVKASCAASISITGLSVGARTHTFFVAAFPIKIMTVRSVWPVADQNAILDIRKDSGNQATATGPSILTNPIPTTTGLNQVVARDAINGPVAVLQAGDRLSLKVTGNLSTLLDGCVTIFYQRA